MSISWGVGRGGSMAWLRALETHGADTRHARGDSRQSKLAMCLLWDCPHVLSQLALAQVQPGTGRRQAASKYCHRRGPSVGLRAPF